MADLLQLPLDSERLREFRKLVNSIWLVSGLPGQNRALAPVATAFLWNRLDVFKNRKAAEEANKQTPMLAVVGLLLFVTGGGDSRDARGGYDGGFAQGTGFASLGEEAEARVAQILASGTPADAELLEEMAFFFRAFAGGFAPDGGVTNVPRWDRV